MGNKTQTGRCNINICAMSFWEKAIRGRMFFWSWDSRNYSLVSFWRLLVMYLFR
jgi:hypothetical protein